MSVWADGYVTANGIRLHYTRTGGDKPPLLLLHGVTDQGLCWAEFARRMEADYDVIMMDARGHGLSDGDGAALSVDALVADAAGLINGLELPPCSVIGHSMGGMTAAYLAAYYPELVRSLVLEDPALISLDQPLAERQEWAARSRASAEEARRKPRAELVEGLQREHPHWSREEVERWADARPNVRADTASLLLSSPRHPWRVALAWVLCPVLLLRPDPDKGITSAETAEEMQRLCPTLRVEHVPGAGHCIRRDRPDQYERLVREFLAQV